MYDVVNILETIGVSSQIHFFFLKDFKFRSLIFCYYCFFFGFFFLDN